MKRKIRPAEEEISGVIPAIVFTAVWYSVLIRSIAAAGFDPFLLVFLAVRQVCSCRTLRSIM